MKLLSNLTITDESILTAALLHDIIEDTTIKKDFISEAFSPHVANLVEECTRPEKYKDRKYEWNEGFKDKSIESVLIKIADRFCNTMDFYHTPEKKDYAVKYAIQGYPFYSLVMHEKKDQFIRLMGKNVVQVYGLIAQMNGMEGNTFNLFSEDNHEEAKKLSD